MRDCTGSVMRYSRIAFALVACIPVASACRQSDADVVQGAQVVAFDTATVHLSAGRDTVTIRAEVARTPQQKTMGLMERRSLAEDAGMLFVYEEEQPADAGFWMYRTRIPLDIAFADSLGRIVAIRRMEPCNAQLIAGCPSYAPEHPYRVALEVNAGLLARRGVMVGSRLWSSALRASIPARR